MFNSQRVRFVLVLVLLASNTGIADLTDGLVAYWPFIGDATDISGNGHHGVVHGPTLIPDLNGFQGSAYHFDGINDYINIGNKVKPPLPMTVSMWLKVDNFDKTACVFRNDQVDHGGFRYGLDIQVASDGRIIAHLYEGFSAPWYRRSYYPDYPLLEDNNWHHVCVVYKNLNSIIIYFDGHEHIAPFLSGSGSGMSYRGYDGAIGHHISNQPTARNYFPGSVDEVCVYNRALANEEILELFAEGFDTDRRAIVNVYPHKVINSARVPVQIFGLGLEPGIQVELKAGEIRVPADAVVLSSPYMLIAQFDFSTTLLGEYDVSVIWPDGESIGIEKSVTIRKLPDGALYEFELDLGRGQVWADSIMVPNGLENLFVTLQKSTLTSYGRSWASTLKLLQNAQQIASTSGSHDLILQTSEPFAGAYSIEVTAQRAGRGILTVWDKLPELPIDQWVVGKIHCSYGSTWYQLEVPPEQDKLYFEAEAIGLWSHFDVFYEEYGGSMRWTSRQGPRVEFEIPNPTPGTYIVEFLDSAMIKGDGRWAIDQSRDVLIRANSTTTIEAPPTYLPAITGLSTDRGGNTGLVTVEITGAWLDPNAVVSLIHPDQDDIVAQTVSGDPNGSMLTTTFDLKDMEPGEYTLNVTNPDGHEIVAPTSFTIEEGGKSELWVEIVGREILRAGRTAKYVIRYGNSGLVNAEYPYLFIAVPRDIYYTIDGAFATLPNNSQPSVVGSDPEALQMSVLSVPKLSPSSVCSVNVHVNAPSIGDSMIIANITSNQEIVYNSMLAFAKPLFEELTSGVKTQVSVLPEAAYVSQVDEEHAFPHRDDSDYPPADYIMFWFKRTTQGAIWHVAKSLGSGEFIEIMPDPPNKPDDDPDINIWRLSDRRYRNSGWEYWGAYRLPGSIPSEQELRERVQRLREKYGIDPGEPNGSVYNEQWCEQKYGDDKIETYCFGLVFALNYDNIYIENGWISEPELYNNIREEGELEWSKRTGMPVEKKREYLKRTNECFKKLGKGIEHFFRSVSSTTPEDKYGPIGFDLADTLINMKKRFIKADREFYYRVDFWNKEDATAPAYDVLVEDSLDPNLDWSSFRFESVGFRRWNIELVPCQYFNVDIDMRPDEDWIVNVEGTFDSETGTETWWFKTLDPATRETPEDPMAGFLPPITDSGEEIGWVGYTIRPLADLTTGTQIGNQAFVEFDHAGDLYDHPAPKEEPWINTIDAGAPTSNVLPLPEIIRETTFAVEWTGQDDEGGSGIAGYDIYVSEDRGPFTQWLADTNDTSKLFLGEVGKTYAFYSVATDHTGNQEDIPSVPDATTSAKDVELIWHGRISSSEDDGYAFRDEFQNLAFDFLKVGPSNFYPLPYYVSGMVFRDVNVPQGARIVSARLKLCSHTEQLTADVFGTIKAEDSDNAVAFSIFSSVNDRPKTSASVDWDYVEPWAPDTWYESPNIAEVIQEVINRGGWSQGNSLALFYSTRTRDGGYRQFSSYDRSIVYAPILEITYEP